MATLKKRVSFFDSAEGLEIRKTLDLMSKDIIYNTEKTYSANAIQHPDNTISFTEKHMNYLNSHPSISPSHYLSNLRLRTRLK